MSDFTQNARGMGHGMAENFMSGFKLEAIPVYASLAEEFVVFDRWFASMPSSTQPNCLFVHLVTAHDFRKVLQEEEEEDEI
jgi:phospholipase C